MARSVASRLMSLLGAIVGGILAVLLFRWFYHHHFFAPFLPGVLIGLGCSALSGDHSTQRGMGCGLAAIVVGLYCIWENAFPHDQGRDFLHFLLNLSQVEWLHLVLILLGGLVAFLLGRDHWGSIVIRPRKGTEA